MTETMLVSVTAAVFLGVLALGVPVWTRINRYRRALRKTKSYAQTGPYEGYSQARYQPMARVFAGDDADFLRRHVNCPELAAQWKRSQRRVVRLYLEELAGDFHRLHREARVMVAQSPERYSVLVPLLFKQQFTFWRALLWIEMRLLLGGAGMPQINPEALIGAVESMRREISRVDALA